MLIEFLEDKVIAVDKKPAMKNLRINITPSKQMRLKVELIDPDSNHYPLDLEVYEIGSFQFKLSHAYVNFIGKERINQMPFNLRVGYDISHHLWKIDGKISGRNIKENIHPENIVGLLPSILSNFIKK